MNAEKVTRPPTKNRPYYYYDDNGKLQPTMDVGKDAPENKLIEVLEGL